RATPDERGSAEPLPDARRLWLRPRTDRARPRHRWLRHRGSARHWRKLARRGRPPVRVACAGDSSAPPHTRRESRDVKRLERLLGMALLLSARRRLRAEELARRFEVSLRTVYRDVRALQNAGFPVAGTAGDGYLLPAGSQLRPLALDPAEAEALALGARL